MSAICIFVGSVRRRTATLAARANHMDDLFRIYSEHLKTPQAREEMDELAALW